jgi:hypothetical protein
MSEKKTHKPKFFQLAVMEELVKAVPFLQTQHQQMKESAKEKLGYHWNEVVQNILFNRYVKPDEKLLARYRTLLKQYRQEKKARKAAKKAKKGQAGPAAPLPPPPPIVNAKGEVDTRLTTEQTTNGAGYSYETPNFVSPSSSAFKQQSTRMAQMVGATLLGESTTQPITSTPLSMSPAAQALCNSDHVNWLFESYFSTTGTSDQPASQARLDEIKRDNERSAAAQLKQAGTQEREFTQKLDDGSLTIPVTDEHPKVDPLRDQMENATEDAAKHVRLNRGLNSLDQTLIGQPNLPKSLLDRYREQAGEQAFKDSEEKLKQYRKEPPQALPPGRMELVKEGWLVGKDPQGGLHRFEATSLRFVDELPAQVTRLELRGLANGQALLREGHDFYVSLDNNEFLCIPLDKAPAPAPVRLDRRLYEQLQRQTTYKSRAR